MKWFLLWILPLQTAYVPVQEEGRIRPAGDVTISELKQLLVIPSKKDPLVFVPFDSTDNPFKELSDKELVQALIERYERLQASDPLFKKNSPSKMQLMVEAWLTLYPFVLVAAFFFLAALIFPTVATALAFFILSLILAGRIFILERPPVANMEETLLYVPWVMSLIALIFRNKMALTSIAIPSFILLFFAKNPVFENTQAVLNSSQWLTIHVLMVVGSYGAFLFSAALAHIALFFRQYNLEKIVLNSLYLGILLLVAGTLLGGVWAHQSWGRFWDWDPKESWAFITICIYLSLVHAYRFSLIGSFGLFVGSIIGALFVTFTWYGVNYLLGVGLHTYGFGKGSPLPYFAFILAELLFLLYIYRKKVKEPCS